MPGQRMTPEQRSEAVAMKAAGYTLASIADRTGISVRTLSRHFSRIETKPEPITDELVQRERERMLEAIDSSERVREAIASSMLDSFALTRAIRAKVALAVDVIDVEDHERAREAARALAQLASALKATSAVTRSAMGDDDSSPAKPTVLEIREMTSEEIAGAQHDSRGGNEVEADD